MNSVFTHCPGNAEESEKLKTVYHLHQLLGLEPLHFQHYYKLVYDSLFNEQINKHTKTPPPKTLPYKSIFLNYILPSLFSFSQTINFSKQRGTINIVTVSTFQPPCYSSAHPCLLSLHLAQSVLNKVTNGIIVIKSKGVPFSPYIQPIYIQEPTFLMKIIHALCFTLLKNHKLIEKLLV